LVGNGGVVRVDKEDPVAEPADEGGFDCYKFDEKLSQLGLLSIDGMVRPSISSVCAKTCCNLVIGLKVPTWCLLPGLF
jgi:hypothetical protein